MNAFRHQLGRKPVILMRYGRYVCANANARGEGPTMRKAYHEWLKALSRWVNNKNRRWYMGLDGEPREKR